jgi:hypothetical protein
MKRACGASENDENDPSGAPAESLCAGKQRPRAYPLAFFNELHRLPIWKSCHILFEPPRIPLRRPV